ncbi:MAG: hypothetical protein KF709_09080 [Gemmatimonadaceae bacterium]|nr:hypothetical protein [Gemmatimonadaceae bacterium]
MTAPTPPYAPERATPVAPALAAAAARAALGGPREALLGTLMCVRLAQGLLGVHPLPSTVRSTRAGGARNWLTALAVPSRTRTAFQKAIAASAGEDRAVMADALEGVTEVTAPHLDRGARSELTQAIAALRR